MKVTSAVLSTALLFTLSNAVALPANGNAVEARDEEGLDFDIRDLIGEDAIEDALAARDEEAPIEARSPFGFLDDLFGGGSKKGKGKGKGAGATRGSGKGKGKGKGKGTGKGKDKGKGKGKGKTNWKYKNFPRSATCANNKYNVGNIKDAGNEGGRLQHRSKQVGKNKYPHRYGNAEKLKFDNVCKGTLYEFPILPSKRVYSGSGLTSDPDADRIVLNVDSKKDKKKGTEDVTITFCGMMTHTNAPKRNGFVECDW